MNEFVFSVTPNAEYLILLGNLLPSNRKNIYTRNKICKFKSSGKFNVNLCKINAIGAVYTNLTLIPHTVEINLQIFCSLC